MRSYIQRRTISERAGLIVLGVALMSALVTGCGSATPTGAPTVPGAAAPASASPDTAPSPAPVVSLPAAVTPPAEPTKFALAVSPTPEPAARATNTLAPVARPSAPTGKFAYTIVTGREPKFFTIWVANANGSNPHQILTHAQWPTFSPDGKQIAYFGRPEGKSEGLYIANSDGGGAIGPLVISPGFCCMNWSRDGAWIVYALSSRANEPGGPLWKVKVDGVFQTRVDLRVNGNGPAFSPDSKQIVFSGGLPNTNTLGLMLVSAEGGAPRQITTDNGGNADWSPRGDKIVYQARDNANAIQVYTVNPDGSGKRQLTHGKSNDGQPTWSRDGGSIFWRSDQNGTAWAIYVMNADGTNARKLIDNASPNQDLWGWESLSSAP